MDKSALLLAWSTHSSRVVSTTSQPSAHINPTTLEPRREYQLRNGSQNCQAKYLPRRQAAPRDMVRVLDGDWQQTTPTRIIHSRPSHTFLTFARINRFT